jgi:DNA-binding CsgD family transcriptional regulator
MRRRLLLTAACRLCGSTRFKKDAVAVECVGCGAIRPRRASDEKLVAAIAGWEECPLSAAELRTLRAIFALGTYEQVAADLGCAASTVRTHMHNVYVKLGTPNSAQACLVAYERGWLRDDEQGRDGRERSE